MHKVLVVYGTKSGCTTGVAERIAARLSADGLVVDVIPAEDKPDPDGYDAVFVGSGVRVGQWHAPAREWVASNAGALKERPLAMFTVGLTMAAEPEKADEVRGYTAALLAETGITPIGIGLFAGCFEPKEFSFVERTVLKAMKAPQGDHRDWEMIDAWVESIVSAFPVRNAPQREE